MNREWAIERLKVFIDVTALTYVTPPSGVISPGTYRTQKADPEIVKMAQVVEQILDRTVQGWQKLDVSLRNSRWARHREAAIRAREALEREEEVNANLGEKAPELSAAELHPWIWGGAKSLWQSGHYREAVEGAVKKLNAETQNKVGRRDVSETDLFKQAFSVDEPKPGKARLRSIKDNGSDTYKSVQRGAMSFAEGVFAGIRNPLSHEADQELSEQEGLEYLAALSVLARWVDTAEMESAP